MTKLIGKEFDIERFMVDFERYRQTQGLTLCRLSKMTGFSENHLTHLRHAHRTMTLYAAVVFADVADLSLDDYRRHWSEQSAVG